jgi:DNA modification methylase
MTPRVETIFDVVGRGPVHPFPARMAPGIALSAMASARRPLRVLDPMMGSGTVLALAQSKGHIATGVDIDPLAVLIGRVWTKPINKTIVRKTAKRILASAKRASLHRKLKDAYPQDADGETRKFVRYWFDGLARRQLACLSDKIRRCRDGAVRDAIWCGFSRLIIAKQAGASRALDLSHSRPHRFFQTAPKKPFNAFLASVDYVLNNCLSKNDKTRGPATKINLGDARQLRVGSNTIDLVLTSPPYLNAIDYLRCSKFSLVWMGKSAENIRIVRKSSIGTEVGQYKLSSDAVVEKLIKSLVGNAKVSARHKAMIRRFIEDMSQVVREAARVLKPRGKAIFVVGENTLKGTYIRNSRIILKIAESVGLELKHRSLRALPPNRRYLPPPAKRHRQRLLNARMRREVVLTFSKKSKATKA